MARWQRRLSPVCAAAQPPTPPATGLPLPLPPSAQPPDAHCSPPPSPLPRPPPPPQLILSSKIAPRALAGVNSQDALCARHALALAALVARDAPALFLDHVAHLIRGNLDVFGATGSMSATEAAAAMAAAQAAAGGSGKPVRPPKDVVQVIW